jgi:hypothetical protein
LSRDWSTSIMSRREMFGTLGKAAASGGVTPVILSAIVSCAMAENAPLDNAPLNGIAGLDRVAVLPGT